VGGEKGEEKRENKKAQQKTVERKRRSIRECDETRPISRELHRTRSDVERKRKEKKGGKGEINDERGGRKKKGPRSRSEAKSPAKAAGPDSPKKGQTRDVSDPTSKLWSIKEKSSQRPP